MEARLPVSWECKTCKHVWTTAIKNRTRPDKPSGCPRCCTKRTSKIEKVFRDAFLQEGTLKVNSDQNEYVFAGRKYQIDILAYFNNYPIAIEYDGEFFHSTYFDLEKVTKDIRKTSDLLRQGNLVVRIREGKLPFLNIVDPSLFQLNFEHKRQSKSDDSVKITCSKIVKWIIDSISAKDINKGSSLATGNDFS